MKLSIRISFLFIAIQIVSLSYSQEKFNYQQDFEHILLRTLDVNDSLFHKKLHQRFEVNDSTLSDFEVLALLINFTSNSHYDPYNILEKESAIGKLIQDFEYQTTIQKSNELLKTNPYNQNVLFKKAFAHAQLKQMDSAKHYKQQFNRIMDAMAYSGTGSSSSAIFSLGSKDSENYIYKKLAKDIMTIGSGVDSSGNFMDVVIITDHQKDTSILYFQIQHAVNRLIQTE